MRHCLNVDQVDVFFIEYVSPADDITQVQVLLDELRSWKDSGVVRYVGVTTHNRAITLEMIERHQCDVLMHRYNMAHRQAEKNVLPAAQISGIAVVAFTCTRWGTLLKGHPNWKKEPPTAADCYRYVLHHPGISLVLTAPKTRQQLEANLSVLHVPQLQAQEIANWQNIWELNLWNWARCV